MSIRNAIFGLMLILSTKTLGAEMAKATLTSAKDISVLIAPGGCTVNEKILLGLASPC